MKREKATVDRLGYALARIHQLIRNNTARANPTWSNNKHFERFVVLRNAEANGGKITQAEIVDRMKMLDRYRISKICSQLEDEGLITRYQNPENKRENILELTAEGNHVIQDFIQSARKANQHIYNGMSDEQVEDFFRSLSTILANLEGGSN